MWALLSVLIYLCIIIAAVLIGKCSAGSVFPLWKSVGFDSHFICLISLMKTERGNAHWWDEMQGDWGCFELSLSEIRSAQGTGCHQYFFSQRFTTKLLSSLDRKLFYQACIWNKIVILHLIIVLSIHICLSLLSWHFRVCSSTYEHFKQINISFWCLFPLHY